MEKRRIKYRLTKSSSAPSVTLVLSLISAALIAVVYWPALYKYFTQPAAADLTLTRMAWVYGTLIGCYVLFGIFTALLGKKTMVLSAIVSLPIFIFYIIEKCGPLYEILTPNAKGLAGVYADNPAYFSGRNLAYIIAAAVFALLALVCFWSIIFNRGRSRTFAMFVIFVCAVARVLFALYDVRINYQPLADAGTMDGKAYILQILLHVAAVIFFFILAVLAIELRRHFPDEEKAAAAAAVPTAAPTSAPAPAQPAPTTLGVAPVEKVEPVKEQAAPAEPVTVEEAVSEPVEPAPKPKRSRAKKPPEAVEAPAEAPAEVIETVEAEPVAEAPKRSRAKKQESAPAE